VGVGVFVGVLVTLAVTVVVGVRVTVGVTVALAVLVGVGVAQIHNGLSSAVPLPLIIVTTFTQATLNMFPPATLTISTLLLQLIIENVVPVLVCVPPYKNHSVQQIFV
jgi:hypothetical protein